MEVTKGDIEKYLEEVKSAINAGKYRVWMNHRRQDNQDLFIDYVIDEKKREQISLYIKFNKLEEQYVIIISFHKQGYPLKYKVK